MGDCLRGYLCLLLHLGVWENDFDVTCADRFRPPRFLQIKVGQIVAVSQASSFRLGSTISDQFPTMLLKVWSEKIARGCWDEERMTCSVSFWSTMNTSKTCNQFLDTVGKIGTYASKWHSFRTVNYKKTCYNCSLFVGQNWPTHVHLDVYWYEANNSRITQKQDPLIPLLLY